MQRTSPTVISKQSMVSSTTSHATSVRKCPRQEEFVGQSSTGQRILHVKSEIDWNIPRHYSTTHFREKLKQQFGWETGVSGSSVKKCPFCNLKIDNSWMFVRHVGQVHNQVEKFLAEEARIPVHQSTRSRTNQEVK